jgi:hypothetical protein
MGVTSQEYKTDVFADQEWGICQTCGLLQLTNLIPLELLYSENHSQEAVGEIWNSHHSDFSEFINLNTGNRMLEIGGAHGALASKMMSLNAKNIYTVVEPSPGVYPLECNVITDYIENRIDLVANQNSILHSHILEHLYSPSNFIRLMSLNMSIGSKMYVSFPNIEELLRTGGANSLNFEHTYYLTPQQLKILCSNHGLRLIRSQKFRSHSYFWELERVVDHTDLPLPSILHKAKEFDDLWKGVSNYVEVANDILQSREVPTFIFGAHIFSQALINMNLDVQGILGILDNATHKQGKRLYGTELNVFPPSEISKYGEVRILLRATHYQEEIRNQILELNPNAIIVE